MLRFLRVNNNVIAFSSDDAIHLAKYVICFPENVQKMPKGGYSIFNHRTGQIQLVKQHCVKQYKIGGLVTKDATSVYRVCSLIKGVSYGS